MGTEVVCLALDMQIQSRGPCSHCTYHPGKRGMGCHGCDEGHNPGGCYNDDHNPGKVHVCLEDVNKTESPAEAAIVV